MNYLRFIKEHLIFSHLITDFMKIKINIKNEI